MQGVQPPLHTGCFSACVVSCQPLKVLWGLDFIWLQLHVVIVEIIQRVRNVPITGLPYQVAPTDNTPWLQTTNT